VLIVAQASSTGNMIKLQSFIVLMHMAMAVAFQYSKVLPISKRRYISTKTSQLSLATNDNDATTLTVKASELDESLGLTDDEKNVVNVHRICSPSVVYVTSVLKSMGSVSSSNKRSSRRQSSRKWGRRKEDKKPKQNEEEADNDNDAKQQLPRGNNLGSGSGFVIDSSGYIVTNYHVIQRAYEANDVVKRYENFWDGLAKNTTKRIASEDVASFINGTINTISRRDSITDLPAQVFIRFGTNGGDKGDATSYYACDIVDVAPELDVAVLKMNKPPSSSLKQLSYGSSSDLLVGQSLLAIGNPFGLDRTLSSGLVSALGRSVTGVAGNEIKNCVQTDAAINPGNSGGPLLNLNGEVVGVNTMIITTSGSSAGIGFAVPSDSVKEATDRIIDLDKERQLQSTNRKGRGWLGIDVALSNLEESLKKRLYSDDIDSDACGAFVTAINAKSPLLNQQDILKNSIHVGERIVNVGGTSVANGNEFVIEMKKRVEGEQLSMTVANNKDEKRVVYVTLGSL